MQYRNLLLAIKQFGQAGGEAVEQRSMKFGSGKATSGATVTEQNAADRADPASGDKNRAWCLFCHPGRSHVFLMAGDRKPPVPALTHDEQVEMVSMGLMQDFVVRAANTDLDLHIWNSQHLAGLGQG